MKKLNKKGFTLVELLAVIVILAVVMVITIPTVLGSMGDANKKAFESAVQAVQKYIDDQADICKVDLGSLASYDNIFLTTSGLDECKYINSTKYAEIIEKAGYKGKIDATEFQFNQESVTLNGVTNKYDTTTISYAKGAAAGEFKNQEFGTKRQS